MAYAEIFNGYAPQPPRTMVQTLWNEQELIKQVPGARWDKANRFWTVPLSYVACVQLRGVFSVGLKVGPELNKWVRQQREWRIDPALGLRDQYAAAEPELCDPRLHPFQQAGVNFLNRAVSALLGDEMGTGKTVQALSALDPVQDLPALVICPNAVKANWALEAATWLPEAVPYVVTGTASARNTLLNRAAKDPAALVIVNFEALRTHSKLAAFGSTTITHCVACGGKDPAVKPTACESHARILNQIPFRAVVVDEAHRIKEPHAKQTRATWALGHGATVKRRLALTGTPIADNARDLWSILHFLDQNEFPRRSTFTERYCLVSWGVYGGLEVVGLNPQHRDEFHKVLHPRFRRMPKALVLPQLPPKVRSRRMVELSPKQLKAYREIDKQLATRLPDGTLLVTPDNLEAHTRLLQFASATLQSTEDGKYVLCDPSTKLDQLLEDLEDLGDVQVGVSAVSRQLIDLAAARLTKANIPFGLITGKQQLFEREVALRDFQAGKLRVLLYTVQAGGTGLTMTAAGTLIRLQRSWSMIDNLQGEDRHHRIGSEKLHDSIHIIDYVARDTVEEGQLQKLWEKSERLEEITQDRERLRAAGRGFADLDAEEASLMSSFLGG